MNRSSSTPAIVFLREVDADFTEHFYDYRGSGAAAAARTLGVDEHKVIKTLVMEDENREPFVVLMHGDKRVSTKRMAKTVRSKSVRSVSPKEAQRYTGYVVGGISPFGTRRRLPVYIEESILSLDTVYVNAGRRGFLVQMKPQELVRILNPTLVNVSR